MAGTDGMKVCLIVYDNDSFIHWFPLGTAYVAAALRAAGHDVRVYHQDHRHTSEADLAACLEDGRFDVVAMGVIGGYYQYRKLLKIARSVRSLSYRPHYVIAGHGPAPEPAYFLEKTDADVVILGEGERTAVELLDALADGGDLASVAGIAFREAGETIVTKRRELIRPVDSIAHPAWDLFPIDYYSLLRMPHATNRDRCFPIISARGCPYECNFCYRMDQGCRVRSPESVIEEIQILRDRYAINYVIFGDELMMTSPGRAKQMCRAMLDADLRIKWSCQGRLNFATPDVLELMRDSGCMYINYGIECFDDEILAVMNKQLTCEEITAGVEATLAAGISPGYNIIFGNIGETAETLNKGVEFLLKYDDHAQLRTIRPVTPYPGSPLYYHAIEQGLLDGPEDFYEHKHTNSDLLAVNFTKLTDEQFYQALYDANRRLLENYHDHARQAALKTARRLYFERDASFRGFRQT